MSEKLKIVITGDSKSAQGAVNDFDDSVTTSGKNLVKYGALAAAAGAAFVVTKSIQAATKFEAAISDLSAITGATGEDLEFLSEKSKEFGRTTTLSAIQAAEAFKLVASAKPDLLGNAEALAAVTREAITLAEASGSTLPDAARTLGSALNQFNADASESGRFINVLAAGAQKGASEIADTAMALKESGTVASSAGISFESLNATIQSLSTVSIKGSQAGTQLRNIFLKLQTQAEEGFNPAIVGMEQALVNLNAANLSTTELTKLFGLESVTAAQTLIKQADSIGELTKSLTGTNTAYDQASTKTDNLEGDMKAMNSAIEGVAITLGEELGPELRTLAQDATKLIGAMAPVAVATAQAIIIAFKPVTTIFKAISTGMEAFQAGAEASDSKVRGVMQSVDAFNKVLIPNRELLKEMGVNVRDIDPRNIDEVSAAMMQLGQHAKENNIQLEKGGALRSQIAAQEAAAAAKTQEKEKAAPEPLEPTVAAKAEEGQTKEELQAERAIAATEAKNQRLREMAEEFELGEREREVLRMERENEQFNLDLENLLARGLTVDEALEVQRQGREDAEFLHKQKLKKIDGDASLAQQKLALVEQGERIKTLQNTMTGLAKISGSAGKKMFKLQKANAIATALVNIPATAVSAYKAMAGIPIIGPALGAAAAAAAVAAGVAQVATIKGQKGPQAHAGLDRNPAEGTMLLRRDEMVLDPGTSKEVRENIKGATERPRPENGGGGIVIGEVNIVAKADMRNMTADEWDEIVEEGLAQAIRRGVNNLLDFGLAPTEEFA